MGPLVLFIHDKKHKKTVLQSRMKEELGNGLRNYTVLSLSILEIIRTIANFSFVYKSPELLNYIYLLTNILRTKKIIGESQKNKFIDKIKI